MKRKKPAAAVAVARGETEDVEARIGLRIGATPGCGRDVGIATGAGARGRRSVSRVTGKVETLQLFVLQSRFTCRTIRSAGDLP
jgi:hypothetical protein